MIGGNPVRNWGNVETLRFWGCLFSIGAPGKEKGFPEHVTVHHFNSSLSGESFQYFGSTYMLGGEGPSYWDKPQGEKWVGD